MVNIKTPKKLIEVALPLDDINAEAAREKSIRHGHPSTLHLWWARRPLAAARAVLFAQLVNDPGYERHLGRGMNKEIAQKERERLFGIIRRLVKWENVNNEEVLNEAREEIWKSWRETCELNKGVPGFDPDKLPAFHDPFAGGGAIPLEAQRLGLESFASDLNPVAVMLNKAMIEIPQLFSGLSPVNHEYFTGLVETGNDWKGPRGLSEDVRYYGEWMRNEAQKRIGHLYPDIELPNDTSSGKAKVIAWIWARTVRSPNPAFNDIHVPLVRSFWLSTKVDKKVWIEPVVDGDRGYQFVVRYNGEPKIEGTISRNGGICLLSGTSIPFDYIRNEAKAGRIGSKLMAIVAEGSNGRVYISPTIEHEMNIELLKPANIPETELPRKALGFRVQEYGFLRYHELFSDRQLTALATFSDLIPFVRQKIIDDINECGNKSRRDPIEYANAVVTYLALVIDKCADYWSSLCSWHSSGEKMRNTFGRQALPMVWDYAEANPFSASTGNWMAMVDWVWKSIPSTNSIVPGNVLQEDASKQKISYSKVISTDPPYYDNIGYADLSDFFYLWLRRSIKFIYPELFATLTVPKIEELIANPYRHGGKEKANHFFLEGMTHVMSNLSQSSHPAFPITIYYAFKQSETSVDGTASTGWVTFLEAIIQAGICITGTWPMSTEMSTRQRAVESNALASSIVLVCRPRSSENNSVDRRTFIKELNEVLPVALDEMIKGKVSAVDLQQSAIGPGISVFSRHSSVLEADGTTMSVKTALQLINKVVDAYLSSTNTEMDSDTLFCLNWFDQYGWIQGEYGRAQTLATSKGTSVEGMKLAGVLDSGHGRVRLLRWQEYPNDWVPELDNRTPVWEAIHQLIRALQQQGEQAAGKLLAGMPARSDAIRSLAYRLYTLCERKGWADDARAYNELIASWDAIDASAHEIGHHGTQLEFF